VGGLHSGIVTLLFIFPPQKGNPDKSALCQNKSSVNLAELELQQDLREAQQEVERDLEEGLQSSRIIW
jgi:hypothetical protein